MHESKDAPTEHLEIPKGSPTSSPNIISSSDHKKAVKVINIFSALTPTYQLMFSIPAQRKAAVQLYDTIGADGVMTILSDFMKYRDRKYSPVIANVTDFLRMLPRIEQFIEKEKKNDSKEYNQKGSYTFQQTPKVSKSTNPFYKRPSTSV